MKNIALLTSLLLLLTACASGGAGRGGANGPFAPPGGSLYERQVIGALGETKANATQRAAVLVAFDRMAPLLTQNDRSDVRTQREWDALDPHAANYLAAAEAVASQAASVAADRLKILAAFNQAVATTLDGTQWDQWSYAMKDQRAAFENARRIDPTYRPGGQ